MTQYRSTTMTGTYAPLPPKTKKRWVQELRSGEYAQRTGSLAYIGTAPENESYCCLGVLAMHCGLKRKMKVKVGYGGAKSKYGPAMIPCDSATISSGMNESKIPDWARDVIGLDVDAMNELIAMNDSGYTFPQIANWIEENL